MFKERRFPDAERGLARLRDAGYGSVVSVAYVPDPARMEMLRDYGFSLLGGCSIIDKRRGGGSIKVGDREMTGLLRMLDPTPAQLAEFEELCALKAAQNPLVDLWYFSSECPAGCLPLAAHLDVFARFLTNEEIAGELGIAEETVKQHASSVYRKLGVGDRRAAARAAAAALAG